MNYVIETTDLTKIYPNKIAVNKVSMHVGKGDIYGLIGKNGAGKTTLMKMLLGLIFPNSGEMTILGEKSGFSEARKKIGSLIEDPGLYTNCTAKENLKRFSILYGVGEEKIPELLTLVGLGSVGDKQVRAFSLGMKQRLGIAVSLLSDPEILILDEPMNGLDPEGIRDMRDLYLKLNREKGVTIIISSHILDELSKIASVYGIMNNGFLVEEVNAAEIEAKCATHVSIHTNNDEEAERIILEKYPDITVDKDAHGLILTCDADLSSAINGLLIRSGLDVLSLSRSENDFENFFIERLG